MTCETRPPRLERPAAFLVSPMAGYAPTIGRLVSMLEYTRYTSMAVIRHLDPLQFDYKREVRGNSIGRLLAHVAALERVCQIEMFEEREATESDLEDWKGVMPLVNTPQTSFDGRAASYFFGLLGELRQLTLAELASRDDEWLEVPRSHRGGYPTNNHFLWFHLIEEELFHRGHIVWLARWSREGAGIESEEGPGGLTR